MSADRVWPPQTDGWNHSHSAIAAANGIADGLMGDKYARVEVRSPGNVFRDMETNAVLAVDDSWLVVLDEARTPGWWQEDSPACAERARDAARKWLASFPANLVPGHKQIGGEGSTLTGGNRSTLTGGNWSTLMGGYMSTLTGGNWSTLMGGNRSTLTGGYMSTLTGGNDSTLTGGNMSTLTGGDGSTLMGGDMSVMSCRWWDGKRCRVSTHYVGEDGVLANTKYRAEKDKLVAVAID